MPLYTCKKCGDDNLLSDEMKWSPLPSWCKRCYENYRSEYMKTYRKTESGIRHSRNKTFKYKYGITIEEYEQMLKKQLNGCAICKREFSDKIKPDVDHHHGLIKVRGILCHRCNLALGYLQEDEDLIWDILEYLKRTTWSKEGEENVATIQ